MKLTDDLQDLLNGKQLAQKQHIAMILQSITSEGYPHSAMVSVGEVIALDSEHLRIALWPQTQTSISLAEKRKSNLIIIYNNMVSYLELDITLLPSLDNEVYERTRFEATIKSIRQDIAKYADITSGITVEMHEPEQVLNRWNIILQELLK
ncbi:pyridoxamine 5'-phosphate oxidase family protein [Staphylococcus xylosus]|uniref:pyridoxamine 5'-phosphate oxidase family protein n=1 Tax=Staphylococcus xylosus TaxID=1288 RepID=UPI001C3EDFDA|nr:pyridoxamine 5'-phosphate oxidase family protein [Staphylococcus xylosus]